MRQDRAQLPAAHPQRDPGEDLTGLPQLLRLRRMLGLFVFFYAVVHFTVYLVLDLELNLALVGPIS